MFVSCDRDTLDKRCGEGYHIAITIKNSSQRHIRYIIYWNYPETAIGEYNPLRDGTNGLKTGDEALRSTGRTSCWESYLADRPKEWVYFFDNDSLKNIPWDVVRATERGLLKRQLIDLEYLRTNNFIVTYAE